MSHPVSSHILSVSGSWGVSADLVWMLQLEPDDGRVKFCLPGVASLLFQECFCCRNIWIIGEVSSRYLALSMLVLFSNNTFSSIILLLLAKLELWDSINHEVTGWICDVFTTDCNRLYCFMVLGYEISCHFSKFFFLSFFLENWSCNL